ncbi:MAG: hypothetical protein HFE59_00620 [Clostridiales bacterium]|nr:hypothetical protein [Clostridiales bacterium]
MGLSEIFIKVLNMSVTASYVIAVVMVVRLFISKLPKKYSYALWSIAGLRLIFPFSVSWVFSFFNLSFFDGINTAGGQEYVPLNIGFAHTPAVNTGIKPINDAVNSLLPLAEAEGSVNPTQILIFGASVIWIMGIIFVLGYEVFLFLRTKRLVRQAVLYKDNIYECDNIPTPFVMGIIKPKIYIPFHLGEEELSYILCHEKYHIKRHDNIIKIIASLLTVIYWFNPFIWAACFYMNRDMEMSCDEKVISQMGNGVIKDYSTYLLSFATNRGRAPLGPLAFGESSVGKRIKNILSFKKPKVWISVFGIMTVVIIGCVCLTDGQKTAEASDMFSKENETIGAFSFEEKNEAEEISDTFNGVNGTIEVFVPSNEDDASAVFIEESAEAWRERNIKEWAEAFCGRDGKKIISMASDECIEDMKESVNFDTEYPSFGWSSPWPFGWDNGFFEKGGNRYRIVYADDNSAEILYYAVVSDPHIFVWRESLTFKSDDNRFVVTSEKIKFLDSISSGEDFFKAYPDGISGSPMDYVLNGMGEDLNRNVKNTRDSGFDVYNELFNADKAALYILNISDEAVSTSVNVENGECYVTVVFKEDGTTLKILMIKPYEKDGIWFPNLLIKG